MHYDKLAKYFFVTEIIIQSHNLVVFLGRLPTSGNLFCPFNSDFGISKNQTGITVKNFLKK
jgi:hypothetical protein